MANKNLLADGDVIGFVSKRPSLEFLDTGLIAFDKGGELICVMPRGAVAGFWMSASTRSSLSTPDRSGYFPFIKGAARL
jgi:hypothetical protein